MRLWAKQPKKKRGAMGCYGITTPYARAAAAGLLPLGKAWGWFLRYLASQPGGVNFMAKHVAVAPSALHPALAFGKFYMKPGG